MLVSPPLLYFDHNSTTPVDPRVQDVVSRANREVFGNPSSAHLAGQGARRMLDRARRGIARALGALDSEIVFTSGGTESNNLAIRGSLREGMHAITSRIEHPSVLEPFRQLERQGVAVTYLPAGRKGVVKVSDLAAALRPNTAIVSIMAANNETGAIQPLAEVAGLLRERRTAGHAVVLHSDGVQAAGKMDVDLGTSGIDLFSISSHKVYAPKGVGVLYVRKGVALNPLHFGGRHERGLRAGTENVAGVMALDCALGLGSIDERQRLAKLREDFERRLLADVPGASVNAAESPRLPNTSSVTFSGVSGEALLIALDRQGMCVSTGAACSSGSVEPSHVLLEMGLTPKQARASLRFSFGRDNSGADIEALAAAVAGALDRVREKQLA